MSEYGWLDLSGSEVRQRLTNRGVTDDLAAHLWEAHNRGDHLATDHINLILTKGAEALDQEGTN